jgi:hypothetical protein
VLVGLGTQLEQTTTLYAVFTYGAIILSLAAATCNVIMVTRQPLEQGSATAKQAAYVKEQIDLFIGHSTPYGKAYGEAFPVLVAAVTTIRRLNVEYVNNLFVASGQSGPTETANGSPGSAKVQPLG